MQNSTGGDIFVADVTRLVWYKKQNKLVHPWL